MADAIDPIETAMTQPQSATVDGHGSATARPLQDLIAAYQYLASKRAMARKDLGLRLFKIQPPGAG